MLSEHIQLVVPGDSPTPLPLREAFFRPRLVEERGIEVFLNGLATQVMQEIDTQIVEEVRSFLFNVYPQQEKRLLDLAALNIQRGRDHGLPSYNQCRIDFGLSPHKSFADITSNHETQRRLEAAYGNVDLIDPWVGGLAEDYVDGANVGELIYIVLKDQFERLRDGDRFWYENDPALTKEERAELKQTTLADIIKRNTGIATLQANVFYA